MTPVTIFSPLNLFVMLGWIVLIAGIVLDRAWMRDKLAGLYWPLALSIGYCVAIALGFGAFSAGGNFETLAGLRQLFLNDWALLAGWAHYLAFDLFVGAWIAREASLSGVSRWFMIPVLPLTFMFGPAGLLLFQILKAAFGKGAQA